MRRAFGSRDTGAAPPHALSLVRDHAGAQPGARGVREPMRSLPVPLGVGLASHLGVLMVASATAAASRQPIRRLLTAWDSKWYLAAAAGYPHHILPGKGNAAQSSLGFFPALPLLLRLVHAVLGTGYVTSGIVVSSALSLLAPVTVWWVLWDAFGRQAATRGTVLVFFSPGAFVLAMVYSEGLLISAVALCLLALRKRHWALAGLCAAVASATDPLGLAAFAPCAIAAWRAVRDKGGLRPLVAPLLAPAGTVGFFSFLWAWVGTPMAWFITQRRGWQGGGFFSGIPTAFSYVYRHGFSDINDTVKTVSVLAIVLLLVAFVRARPGATMTAYVLTTLLLAAASPIVSLTPRVVLRAFPLLGAVGARAPRRLLPALVGFSALVMATLAVMSWGLARIPFTP